MTLILLFVCLFSAIEKTSLDLILFNGFMFLFFNLIKYIKIRLDCHKNNVKQNVLHFYSNKI